MPLKKSDIYINKIIFASSFSTSDEKNADWEEKKHKILQTSLQHVLQYGWTDQALAQGLLTCNYPPSMIGLVLSTTTTVGTSATNPVLLHFFMRQSFNKLQDHLVTAQHSHLDQDDNCRALPTTSFINRLEYAIRLRLSMNEPYIPNQRWAQGMALGVLYPTHAWTTATLLEQTMDVILRYAQGTPLNATTAAIKMENRDSHADWNSKHYFLQKSIVTSVYISTELFMLTDSSGGFQQTWTFLHDRLQDVSLFVQNETQGKGHGSENVLNTLVTHMKLSHHTIPPTILRPELAVGASAVLSSLGGAVVSLLTPVASSSVSALATSIVPHLVTFMQPTSSPFPPVTQTPPLESFSSYDRNQGIHQK